MTAGRVELRLGPRSEQVSDLRAEVSRVDDVTQVRLVGEVDADSAPLLRAALLEVVADGPVVLDLGAVPFLDSAGLSSLVAAHRAAEDNGHVLTVRGARGMCLRVLRISGLHRVLVLDPPVD